MLSPTDTSWRVRPAFRQLIVLGITSVWLVAAGCGSEPPGGEQPGSSVSERGGEGARMRLRVEVSSAPTEKQLQRLYTVDIVNRESKEPVEGAVLRLTAMMPSMPGAHNIRPVEVKPGSRPGRYSARLLFDMPGEWAVFVDVIRPVRNRVVYADTVGVTARDRQAVSDICPGCLQAPEWPEVRQRLLEPILKACRRGNEERDKRCLVRHLERLRRHEGLRVALLTLAAVGGEDQAILRYGHLLAHDLAKESYVSIGPLETLVQCIDVFWGGCYHGTLEQHVEQQGASQPGLAEICGQLRSGLLQSAALRCVEGLGRGLLFLSRFDPSRALAECDRLAHPQAQATCHAGMVQEWAEVLLKRRGDGDISSCQELPSRYAESCFQVLMPLMIERVPSSGVATPDPCGRIPDPHRQGCYRAVGGVIAREFKSDFTRSFDACRSQGDRDSCLFGAVKEVVVETPDQSKTVCQSLRASEKAACYQAVGEALRVRHSSRKELVFECSQAEQEYREVCLKGAGLPRLE